VVLFSGKVTNR